MTKSLLRISFLALVALCAGLFRYVGTLCREVMSWLMPRAAIAKLQRLDALQAASVELSAASAFVKRLVKREKPRIEARWAMCPSI